MLLPTTGGLAQMILKVPSNHNHSVIYDSLCLLRARRSKMWNFVWNLPHLQLQSHPHISGTCDTVCNCIHYRLPSAWLFLSLLRAKREGKRKMVFLSYNNYTIRSIVAEDTYVTGADPEWSASDKINKWWKSAWECAAWPASQMIWTALMRLNDPYLQLLFFPGIVLW